MIIEEQSVNRIKTINYNSLSSLNSIESCDLVKKQTDKTKATLNYEELQSLFLKDLPTISGPSNQFSSNISYNFFFGIGDIYSLIYNNCSLFSEASPSNINKRRRRPIRLFKKKKQSKLVYN